MNEAGQRVLKRDDLQQLIDALRNRGFTVVGPTLKDEAVVYDEIASLQSLPAGWTDEQDGGTYRLKKRADQALFGFAVGPQSWKQFLHPPRLRLLAAERRERNVALKPDDDHAARYAFLGVRACELHAIAIQDRVFLKGPYVDSHYKRRRESTFIVAVNCIHAGGTCFCVSMDTGPRAKEGFDIALTEVIDGRDHYFVTEAGTKRGEEILSDVPTTPATEEQMIRALRVVEETARHMGRTMDTTDIKTLLYRNFENPRWENVASRCLTCANCTMVCPTCFCTTVEDTTDLTGRHAERVRKWDSCFTMDFSYIHGGSVRVSSKSRYRQWMTHKLATWIDQFGTSGCVGCGRCITWCPVGIDITEEVRAIRENELQHASGPNKENDDGNQDP